MQTKADLLRLTILHRHGGIWVDTDTILLRDFRPLAAAAGEFASRMTMHVLYNNNVLALQKNSVIAREILELVCDTPYIPDQRHYCSRVNQNKNDKKKLEKRMEDGRTGNVDEKKM